MVTQDNISKRTTNKIKQRILKKREKKDPFYQIRSRIQFTFARLMEQIRKVGHSDEFTFAAEHV